MRFWIRFVTFHAVLLVWSILASGAFDGMEFIIYIASTTMAFCFMIFDMEVRRFRTISADMKALIMWMGKLANNGTDYGFRDLNTIYWLVRHIRLELQEAYNLKIFRLGNPRLEYSPTAKSLLGLAYSGGPLGVNDKPVRLFFWIMVAEVPLSLFALVKAVVEGAPFLNIALYVFQFVFFVTVMLVTQQRSPTLRGEQEKYKKTGVLA